jgi:hypothetical protein
LESGLCGKGSTLLRCRTVMSRSQGSIPWLSAKINVGVR